ncbi:rhamnulokinase [bacterium]|nr:rhamnulokinase [bacterium]
MNTTQNFIGVDLGGESGRVIVGGFDGHRVKLQEKHRFATGGLKVGSTLRWDVHRFWREIQRGLSAASNDFKEILSVGVDTWGVDYALLDSNETLIELPYHYRDDRNVGAIERTFENYPRSKAFSQTGIQFMDINTLCQLFTSRKSEDMLARSKHLLTMADYFHWCLSGSKTIEFTFATTTQCFDPVKGDWALPMLESLGIPTHMLPPVVKPGTNLGKLRDSVAQETNLRSTSVVAPATHDTASAVVAVPVEQSVGKNWAYISSGTWSLVGMEVDKPVISKAALEANVTNEGGANGTWRLLKNVMGLWIIQRLRLAFSQRGFERSYEELTEIARMAKPTDCFIDPDDAVFLNPLNMEEAILEYCKRTDQCIPSDEGEIVRCVLESLALRYRDVIREVQSLVEPNVDVIHVVGGGCKNKLLNQLISNATGCPVLAGPSEATILGNVMIQCQAAGAIESLSDIRDVVRNSVELKFFEPSDRS